MQATPLSQPIEIYTGATSKDFLIKIQSFIQTVSTKFVYIHSWPKHAKQAEQKQTRNHFAYFKWLVVTTGRKCIIRRALLGGSALSLYLIGNEIVFLLI